jgi:ABC-type branched-subunit amino acid transport system substrate-binding protein
MRRRRPDALMVAMAILLTACGARVTESQIAAADRAASGGGLAPARGATTDLGTAAAGTVGAAGGTTAAGTSGAGSSATSPGSAGQAARAAAGAFTGNNGGATDVGVSADQITLGAVATLSGPVPGLFQGSIIGAQAVVAYQNSLGGLFGRKIRLEARDDQFDTGQNRAQTLELLGKAFAFLGSFSLYDDAAVNEIRASGIPDTTYSLSATRRRIPNNFSIEPAESGVWRTGAINYWKQRLPEAVWKNVGSIHPNVPAAEQSHLDLRAAAEAAGWVWRYDRAFGPTEQDFTADIIAMRQQGVRMFYTNALDDKTVGRIAKAAKDQGLRFDLFLMGGSAYDNDIFTTAGSVAALEGMVNEQQYAMFAGEDAQAIPEVGLFLQWMRKVKPGYTPDLFAAFAWGEGRMLFDTLQAIGNPKITRAVTVEALKKLDNYDGHGMFAPSGPGTKKIPTCYIMVKVRNGKFERFDSPPPGYRCDGGLFKR